MTATTDLASLDAEFDYVAVIDCLPLVQRRTSRLSHSLMDVLHGLGYSFTTFPCDTIEAVRKAHGRILWDAKEGRGAVIDIICHGNEREVGIGDRSERLPWPDLAKMWEPINAAMSGRLLVLMSTCEGINAIKASAATLGEPFFGLIGTKEKQPVETARQINELFFKSLGQGVDIARFIEDAERTWGDNFVRGITAQFWRGLKAGKLGLFRE